mmetsp:Transcript_88600/g.223116  ORF Transcript_88600/g.223116 Transcript_88600/m.223116 type:complete len:591 (+) Transcript_88600:121-1893(+)
MARLLVFGAAALLARLGPSAAQGVSVEVTASGATQVLPQTEAEVEEAEDAEASILDVRLLQKPITPAGALTKGSAAAALTQGSAAGALEEAAVAQMQQPDIEAAAPAPTAPAEQKEALAAAMVEEEVVAPPQHSVGSNDTETEAAASAKRSEVHVMAHEEQEARPSTENASQIKRSPARHAWSSLQIAAEVSQAEVQAADAVDVPQREASVQVSKDVLSSESLQGAIPVAAAVIGFALSRHDGCRTLGLLMIYFGVQTGLNLYMKIVLSNAVVSKERGMKGIPGAFLITALQQVVSFAMLAPIILALWPTPWRYTPKPLNSRRAWAGICGLSLTFALNIGLNNLCLSLLPMSINLMIRSCIPLATWAMQGLVAIFAPGSFSGAGACSVEVMLMLAGVFFAGLASIAKEEGSSNSSESKDLGLGILVGALSLVACALYLIFAQWLGQDVKLNPLDMTLYMSLPAAIFLIPLILYLSHPVGWKDFGPMTDWDVLQEVLHLSPIALALAAMSGVFAVIYNTLQYAMVSELSATHTAFAGNFNKAATIVLSIVLGLESLPAPPWGQVTLISIVGGIGSFTAYSVVRVNAGKGGH